MSLAHLQARDCAKQGFEGCSFSRKVRFSNDASYSALHGSKQWSFYSASELLPITPIPTMLLSRRHTLHKERSVSQNHVVQISDRLEIHRVHTSAFPYPRLAFFTVSLFSDRNFCHRSYWSCRIRIHANVHHDDRQDHKTSRYIFSRYAWRGCFR